MTTYSRFHPGKFSLWADWETSGADFDNGFENTFTRFQGLQVGFVIADNETLEEVDSLKVTFKFDPGYEWQDGAEKVHGLSREFLEANGVTQEEGLATMIEFIVKYFGDEVIHVLDGQQKSFSKKVQVGGHNIDFDIAATQALFKKFGLRLSIHHVKMETSGAAFIAIGEYKSNKVFEFFGGEKRGNHDALDDARLALAAARGIRELCAAALE